MVYTQSRQPVGDDPFPLSPWGTSGGLDELATRVIPIELSECAYARNRHPSERPSIPRPGDAVYYRHYEWVSEVDRATVVEVQDLNEVHDPNLWHLVRNARGEPVLDGGIPRVVQVADPWPWVILQTETYGRRQTWESRVRGSAGWLPLNWRERRIRLPHELLMQPLNPVNT